MMRSKEGTKAGIIAKINYCHARMSCVSLLLADGHNLKGSDLLTISCSSRNSYTIRILYVDRNTSYTCFYVF